MAMKRMIMTDEVISYCQGVADAHRRNAMIAGKGILGKDQRKHDELLAKAMEAESIAEHFRAISDDDNRKDPILEQRARSMDPAAFTSYDAMVDRLEREGHDRSYAIMTADATYGDRLAAAMEKAVEIDEHVRGIEEAISWHVMRAIEAENLEVQQIEPAKKVKYAQRAKRHRLYARHIEQDLIQTRSEPRIERVEEPTLPFPSPPELSTEAQMQWMKRKGMLDEDVG